MIDITWHINRKRAILPIFMYSSFFRKIETLEFLRLCEVTSLKQCGQLDFSLNNILKCWEILRNRSGSFLIYLKGKIFFGSKQDYL